MLKLSCVQCWKLQKPKTKFAKKRIFCVVLDRNAGENVPIRRALNQNFASGRGLHPEIRWPKVGLKMDWKLEKSWGSDEGPGFLAPFAFATCCHFRLSSSSFLWKETVMSLIWWHQKHFGLWPTRLEWMVSEQLNRKFFPSAEEIGHYSKLNPGSGFCMDRISNKTRFPYFFSLLTDAFWCGIARYRINRIFLLVCDSPGT